MTGAPVVLTYRGWGLLAGSLASLLVGYLALNVLLLLVGVLAVSLVGVEVVAFGIATRGFGPDNFRAQRTENSSVVALGSVGTMALEIESRRHGGFYAEIYDRLPEGIEPVAGSPRLTTWWNERSTESLAYAYRGTRRGAVEIGPLDILAHDTFGLAYRAAALEDRWPVQVLPQVALWTTEITERLRSETLGQLLARPPGYGTEFRSLREYQSSDDFRSIVWKRSTFERLLVKEWELESRIDVAVLLDVTRPMGVGPPGAAALDLAVDAALLVARYSFGQGDRVAVLTYSSRPLAFLPLGRSIDQSYRADRVIGAARIEHGIFPLEEALEYLAKEIHRPATVFAFTALNPVPDFAQGGLQKFRRAGHHLHLFVPDPPALYAPLADPLGARAERLVGAPLGERTERAVAAVREAGLPVTTYGRDDLLRHVTGRYVRSRLGELAA